MSTWIMQGPHYGNAIGSGMLSWRRRLKGWPRVRRLGYSRRRIVTFTISELNRRVLPADMQATPPEFNARFAARPMVLGRGAPRDGNCGPVGREFRT